MKPKNRKEFRVRRHLRLRQKIAGTAARPRMSINISNANINVQFIDDDAGVTLAAYSTVGKDVNLNCATAKMVGEKAAEAALAKGIKRVVVDRGGFKFHGRIKALVDAAVASGISILSEKNEAAKAEKTTEEA